MRKENGFPFEAEKKLQIVIEIDNLFCQLKEQSDEEIRKNIENDLRDKIKRYRQILGKMGEEEITEYYKRLKELKKTY